MEAIRQQWRDRLSDDDDDEAQDRKCIWLFVCFLLHSNSHLWHPLESNITQPPLSLGICRKTSSTVNTPIPLPNDVIYV